jgi:hypothetical protein
MDKHTFYTSIPHQKGGEGEGGELHIYITWSKHLSPLYFFHIFCFVSKRMTKINKNTFLIQNERNFSILLPNKNIITSILCVCVEIYFTARRLFTSRAKRIGVDVHARVIGLSDFYLLGSIDCSLFSDLNWIFVFLFSFYIIEKIK